MFLFSDRATPVDFQHADIFSINTYKFTKSDGSFTYVKIHLKTNQGVKNFTQDEANQKAGVDPDFQTRSLYEDIENQKYPTWDVFAQIIDPVKAENYHINIFDATKTFPFSEFPLRKFGKITLNRNVDNFFAEQEQSAFSPTNLVPGWALTPDPSKFFLPVDKIYVPLFVTILTTIIVIQTRALAYADTQRYRLGANFVQLPVNAPYKKPFTPLIRDGAATVNGNLGGTPNYFPSSFYNVGAATQYAQPDEEQFQGTVVNFESEVVDADYVQPRIFWEKTLAEEPGQQDNLISNVAGHLSAVTGDKGLEVRQAVYGKKSIHPLIYLIY